MASRRARRSLRVAVAIGAIVPVRSPPCADPPTAAVLGARIRTLDPAQPWATAVAWRDGVIVAVGDDATVRAACDARTELIDGAGWRSCPGLVDSHQHPLMGADETVGADLAGLSTLDEVRAALAAERARCAPGAVGAGLRARVRDVRRRSSCRASSSPTPSAAAPALLTFFDYHTALATPAALAAAGIDGPRPLDGSAEVVCRDGRPTGALLEPAAFELVHARHAAADARAAPRSGAPTALRRMAAAGLTAVHGMDGSPGDARRAARARGARRAVRAHRRAAARRGRARRGRSSSAGRSCATRTASAGAGESRSSSSTASIEPGTAWLEEADTERPRARAAVAGSRALHPRGRALRAARASSARRTRSATAPCATRSTPIARPARRPASATASSTSRRSATSSSRASPPRASPPRCRRSTCSGCAPTARIRGRGRSVPSAPAAPSAAPTCSRAARCSRSAPTGRWPTSTRARAWRGRASAARRATAIARADRPRTRC